MLKNHYTDLCNGPRETRESMRAADEIADATEACRVAQEKLKRQFGEDAPEISFGSVYKDEFVPKAVVKVLAEVDCDGDADDVLRATAFAAQRVYEACYRAIGRK